MTVQDKGGKGLVKGVAKRERKVLRDNIQSYHPVFDLMRRLQKQKELIYEETMGVIKVFPENIFRDASPFLSKPRERPSPPWTLTTLSR